MIVKRLLIFLALCLVLIQPCFSQEYPTVSIEPWTTKSGEQSTYFKMVEWDSSPYKEYTYIKRNGPNKWDITEYLNFRMLFPKGYETLVDKKYPIIILLHGAGESGIKWTNNFDYANGHKDTPPEPEKIDNNDHQLRYGGRELLTARNRDPLDTRAFPGFAVFPQLPYNGSWSSAYDGEISKYNRQVIELVEILLNEYKIDPNRVYIMGLSNGAHGVWDLINRRPDLFAASILFSGAGDANLMAEHLAHFPIWMFQGGQDDNPTPAAAHKMITALETHGGTPRITVYDELGHNVWDKAFKEPDFFQWLLSKTKLSIHAYNGKTQFETREDVHALLSISPGFSNYQWKFNGEVIDMDHHTLLAQDIGAYQVRFKRGDTWSLWSSPIFITAESNSPSNKQVAYRINVGGDVLLSEPLDWSHDSDSKPSSYLLNGRNHPSIINPDVTFHNYAGVPDALFETGRKGTDEMHYSFPLQGMTEVMLYFSPSQSYEDHVLEILIEDEVAVSNLNIREEGGTDALKKTFRAMVKDERLDITIKTLGGSPILSGIEIVAPGTVTGLPNNNTNQVEVYPNPFHSNLNIDSNENNNIETIVVRDITGRIVLTEKWSRTQRQDQLNVPVSTLSSGIYFLEIHFHNATKHIIKVIKK